MTEFITSEWAEKILGEEEGWGPLSLPCIRLTPSGRSELCDYSQALPVTPNPTTKDIWRQRRLVTIRGGGPSPKVTSPSEDFLLQVLQSLLFHQGPLMLPPPLEQQEDTRHHILRSTRKPVSHPGDDGLLEVSDTGRTRSPVMQTYF